MSSSALRTGARRVLLNSGYPFPLLGFGTYRVTGRENILNSLEAAFKSGYRSIDTASCYDNEVDIGWALKKLLPKLGLKRDEIFVTTKLYSTDQGKGKAEKAARQSLKNLDLDYIDLYLIHWPGAWSVANKSPENRKLRQESWHDLVKLQKENIIHSLGVSNYNIEHLEHLLADCAGVPPAVNQIEMHPRYQQQQLLAYCKSKNILVQAYCSLGGTPTDELTPTLLTDPIVIKAAAQLHKTPAQILLGWALNKGVAIIPKSLTAKRIENNADLEFEIPRDIIKEIDSIQLREKYSWDPTDIK